MDFGQMNVSPLLLCSEMGYPFIGKEGSRFWHENNGRDKKIHILSSVNKILINEKTNSLV